MNNILTFLKKLNWSQALLLFCILAVGIAYIFRVLTPTQASPQTTLLTNSYNIETELNDITFSGRAPVIPERMTTATVANYVEDVNTVRDNLINRFSLTRSEAQGQIWESEQHILSVIEDPNLLVLTPSSYDVTEDLQTGFSNTIVTNIIQNTNKMVEELYPTNPPQLLAENVSYIADSHEVYEEATQQEATQIILPYAYQIDGVPIYVEKELNYVAYFVYDTRQNLLSAQIRPYQLEFSPERSYQALTMPLVMSNINNDRAAIIYTDSLGYKNNAPLITASGDMVSANLEYRFDPVTDTIAPYVRVGGTIVLEDQKEMVTQIISPAIQTNFGEQTQN